MPIFAPSQPHNTPNIEMQTSCQDLLMRLIATPRTSRNEGDAADMLQAHLADLGLQPRREANNLWCVAPGHDDARPTLLLNAHIDTVRPAASWQRDPFSPTLEGDRLYGLGSNDDGASLVCLLEAFRTMCARERTYNMVWLASAEEEVSGRDGVERALPQLPRIDVALVGEPTGMQPAVAEKGLMVLDCVAHGRAGHAARDEGDNAIYHAVDDIQRLRHLTLPRQSALLGPVRLTTTIVSAGTQHNVVPDECRFTVDVRSNECYTNAELLDIVRATIGADVTPRSTRLSSSRIDLDHPLVRRAVALGRTPFGSPTLSDQALMPFPSMKMGPGQSARSHTADEFICLSELHAAVTDYVAMLDGLQL